jgi:hypothetical protein
MEDRPEDKLHGFSRIFRQDNRIVRDIFIAEEAKSAEIEKVQSAK